MNFRQYHDAIIAIRGAVATGLLSYGTALALEQMYTSYLVKSNGDTK